MRLDEAMIDVRFYRPYKVQHLCNKKVISVIIDKNEWLLFRCCKATDLSKRIKYNIKYDRV